MELEDQLEENSNTEEETLDVEEVDSEEAPEDETTEADAKLIDLESQIAALNDQLLRTRADFDNYRKRIARENERTRKMAAESIIRDILPALDNLELALEHRNSDPEALSEGVEMVLKQMNEMLEKAGVKTIEALGCAFNPNVHEAVAKMESEEVEENYVSEVYQKGYAVGDQVIRPTKVVVSSGSPRPPEATED